jgi:hypothetical protein
MKLPFEINDAELVEFGLVIEDDDAEEFVLIPADSAVQTALVEMVSTTEARLTNQENPVAFDPGEKYGATEHLTLALDDEHASWIKSLHEATNNRTDASALEHIASATAYFARIIAGSGERITAVRRATTFKGIVKARGRLLRLVDDSVEVVDDDVFKLDTDFDLVAFGNEVHILRPSGLEFVCHLQGAILAAVPSNIASLKKDLKFVDFDSIETYAGTHPRAARYLASIRTTQDVRNIDQALLKKRCAANGVRVKAKRGKLVVEEASTMGFLEVLDRRRYEVDLVPNMTERFRAASRIRVD